MIDKNTIEEAAYDFEDGELIEDKLKRSAFKLGVHWLLEHLWHDGSDSPLYGEKCLVELTDENGVKLHAVAAEFQGGGWDSNVSDLIKYDGYRITRWLYIDDLLPLSPSA